MTLLAPRLLITLRREYYTHVPGVDLGTAIVPGGAVQHGQRELEWNVRRPPALGNTVELSYLSESRWSVDVHQTLLGGGTNAADAGKGNQATAVYSDSRGSSENGALRMTRISID